MLAEHGTPPIPMGKVIAHELEIYGSHGMQAHRYPDMLAMIQAVTGQFYVAVVVAIFVGMYSSQRRR